MNAPFRILSHLNFIPKTSWKTAFYRPTVKKPISHRHQLLVYLFSYCCQSFFLEKVVAKHVNVNDFDELKKQLSLFRPGKRHFFNFPSTKCDAKATFYRQAVKYLTHTSCNITQWGKWSYPWLTPSMMHLMNYTREGFVLKKYPQTQKRQRVAYEENKEKKRLGTHPGRSEYESATDGERWWEDNLLRIRKQLCGNVMSACERIDGKKKKKKSTPSVTFCSFKSCRDGF